MSSKQLEVYSSLLYGATRTIPPLRELRLVWLPLLDNATLRSLFICIGRAPNRSALPAEHDHMTLLLPFAYVPVNAAILPHAMPYTTGRPSQSAPIRLTPDYLPSGTWVEVTHCSVGFKTPFFYRLPGSGLSLFLGQTIGFNGSAERELRSHPDTIWTRTLIEAGLDTVQFYESLGLSSEIVMLRPDKLPQHADAPLHAGTMSAGEMARIGWLRCGLPPHVRRCHPDEPALRMQLRPPGCPAWYTHIPAERLTDARVQALSSVRDCRRAGNHYSPVHNLSVPIL